MLSGFKYVFIGISLLFTPKLRRFVIIPLLINIALFSIVIYLLGRYADAWIMHKIGSKADWWKMFRFLYDIVVPIISVLLYITLLLISYFMVTLVANIVAAPFNSMLAKATESYLLNENVNFHQMHLAKEIMLTVWIETIKMLRFIIYAIPLLLLPFIPVINVFAPFIWFVFISYMLSAQYADYPMSNHGIFYKQQKQILKQHRLSRLGFGMAINLLLCIPIINFIVMPTSVIGATVWWVKQIKPNLNKNN